MDKIAVCKMLIETIEVDYPHISDGRSLFVVETENVDGTVLSGRNLT